MQMEEGSQSTGYWCYECSRAVETITEVETIKCSLCHGGFVEELDISRSTDNNNNYNHHAMDSESDRTLSLLAPILLRLMSNPNPPRNNRARRFRQIQPADGGDSELNREMQSVMRQRRRSPATILQLVHGTRTGIINENNNDNDNDDDDNNSNSNSNNNSNSNADMERERESERVIVINPFNPRIIVQGAGAGRSPFSNSISGPPQNQPMGSIGDYFVGPDMELLLQHLAENSPARYGTPPAQMKAVETMPTVKIKVDLDNSFQCSVCLEDFEGGNEAKEMPCKHRFHGECIITWLDLHSTCPVCRYQLPSDESKLKRERERDRESGSRVNMLTGPGSESGESGNARRYSVTFPWPFNSLFTSTSTPGTQVMSPHLIINPSGSSESGSGSGSTGQEGGAREDDQ
ncbi:E3 ubiquitin-protein ligase SIRP1-like [Bidens hawaiensis]|uniref:E3 ubiquitin-protein ligase SIRP1-like n=1 Tax=Bidens hawaiensis TaxID=980011 RepID=UPI004049F385